MKPGILPTCVQFSDFSFFHPRLQLGGGGRDWDSTSLASFCTSNADLTHSSFVFRRPSEPTNALRNEGGSPFTWQIRTTPAGAQVNSPACRGCQSASTSPQWNPEPGPAVSQTVPAAQWSFCCAGDEVGVPMHKIRVLSLLTSSVKSHIPYLAMSAAVTVATGVGWGCERSPEERGGRSDRG